MKSSQLHIENKLEFATLVFAVIMAGLAIAGGVIDFSPVPYTDMWKGTVNFIIRINDGDYAAWWDQHNEHRIVLSRVLFWMDQYLFGGGYEFLIIFNYMIVAATSWVYWLFIQNITEEKQLARPPVVLVLFITAWLFLWSQAENLTWAFQSQFFLAQFLPLCALFLLAKASRSATWSDFAIASTVGLLAMGTMANGVLALPVLCLCAFYLRMGIARIGLLFILSILDIAIYFTGYQSPGIHGHLAETLTTRPFGVLHYCLLYIGSPFYFLFKNKVIAAVSSFILLTATAHLAYRQLNNQYRSPYVVALIFFIFYIAGTAAGTAGGRLIFGLEQALSQRYTTPAIMAWAAWMIIIWSSYDSKQPIARKPLLYSYFIISMAMLILQIKALKPIKETIFNREIAALALAMNIKDGEYIKTITPHLDAALQTAANAKSQHLSVFNQPPYSSLNTGTSKDDVPAPGKICAGAISKTTPLAESPDYLRIEGWAFDQHTDSTPKVIRFINTSGTTVGYALSGLPATGITASFGDNAKSAGFVGYIRNSAIATQVTVIYPGHGCHADLLVPEPN